MSTNLSGITLGPADHTVQGTVWGGGGPKFLIGDDERTETIVGVLNCSRDAKKSGEQRQSRQEKMVVYKRLRRGTKWARRGAKFPPTGHPRSKLRH